MRHEKRTLQRRHQVLHAALGGAGYCIVRISPDGVVNEYHSILDPEYCTSIKMR